MLSVQFLVKLSWLSAACHTCLVPHYLTPMHIYTHFCSLSFHHRVMSPYTVLAIELKRNTCNTGGAKKKKRNECENLGVGMSCPFFLEGIQYKVISSNTSKAWGKLE
ncbi:hypothetical protein OTU49_004469 [Cherax quadricarinatus]|uniref:Secreted protein n=1 Tax=Cherax quadricarinatus TaxID=27406 RepID=A0AAW0XH86_CHEQU